MRHRHPTRRDFVKTSAGVVVGTAAGTLMPVWPGSRSRATRPVVSVVRIRNDRVDMAVEAAIDLLGGIETVAKGKDRIMLKPNLVAEGPHFTTKPGVVRTLAELMQRSGKEVLIGEGSAAGTGFNVRGPVTYRTRDREILDGMQQYVFDTLGYTDLARSLKVPLINLHLGDMAEVRLPKGFVFDTITLHRSLTDIDLLCSVPMMKTHVLATVTLGMKNLIGLYPGTVYYSVRSWLHDRAAMAQSPGVAFETIDMVRANKLGLTVIDGSMAMEGNGPTEGSLVPMNLIVAGTNPLATDMVAADIMGFGVNDVPTLAWAYRAGLGPASVREVEVRGEKPDTVRRPFRKPNVVSWESINQAWGVQEL
ncbi:MAG TPA: DUF362 domain-containing protein [Gemmatimonadales bacterium]|nr:DUF362 domain-containing protein [Gemmatimonadales bacterium]